MNILQLLAQERERQEARMMAARREVRKEQETLRWRVKGMLERGSNIHARDADGNTALMYAVGSGDAELVRLLVWAGAEPDAANAQGMTPLMYAASLDALPVVQALLNAGADPYQEGSGGHSAYTIAKKARHSITLKLFQEYEGYTDVATRLGYELIAALYHEESADHIRALLAAGAEVNADDGSGATALHLAVERNAPDIVRLLIEGGARLNIPNEHGWTPLRCAAEESRVECARLLLDAGADAYAGAASFSVLHKAAAWKTSELLRMLLPLGPDLEARDEGGQTPLFYAAQFGCCENLRLLLEAGADASARNHWGSTPLMSLYEDALADEADEKQRLLLAAGAEMPAEKL